MEIFAKSLEDVLQAKPPEGDAKQRWDHLRDTIHGTAFSVFGRKQGRTQTDSRRMSLNVTEEKRTVLLEHKRQLTQPTLQAFRAAMSKVQRTARRCVSDY